MQQQCKVKIEEALAAKVDEKQRLGTRLFVALCAKSFKKVFLERKA